jgi:gluconate kinase
MFQEEETDPLIFVVFGIPGAGKTTIARSVAQKWLTTSEKPLDVTTLDLDDCVPEWMRDNFAVGIYPTLAQRLELAISCCDYVDDSVLNSSLSNTRRRQGVIVSFSFVNQDMRSQFRQRFPSAQWILIDTTEEEAQKRIEQRTDHFYKGKAAVELPEKGNETVTKNDWNFDPVTFPHTVLNGQSPIEENSSSIVSMITKVVDRSIAE